MRKYSKGDRPGTGDVPATDGNHGSGGMEPDMAVGMLLHTNAPLVAPILCALRTMVSVQYRRRTGDVHVPATYRRRDGPPKVARNHCATTFQHCVSRFSQIVGTGCATRAIMIVTSQSRAHPQPWRNIGTTTIPSADTPARWGGFYW